MHCAIIILQNTEEIYGHTSICLLQNISLVWNMDRLSNVSL